MLKAYNSMLMLYVYYKDDMEIRILVVSVDLSMTIINETHFEKFMTDLPNIW